MAEKSKIENRKSSLSTRRVSRFFAMGFRVAADGRAESDLERIQADDWQRGELHIGYDAGSRGSEVGDQKSVESHIQFWLVEGDARGSHAEIEEKILTTKNTNDTKGE